MPRRNRRDQPGTSLPDIETLRVEHAEAQRQATREDTWEQRRIRTQRRDDKRVRAIQTCVWPDCTDAVHRVADGMRPIPLCNYHAFEAHKRLEADVADLRIVASMRRQVTVERGETWTTEARKLKRDAQLRADNPGWIYYLRVDDTIKIGFTVDLRRRLKEYPPNAELLAVHGGSKTIEKDLHHTFRGSLTARREWFTPSAAVTDHIAKVIAEHGEPTRFRPGYKEPAQVTYPRGWSGGRTA